MNDAPSSPPPDDHGPPPAGLAEQIVELSALTGGLAHEIRNPLSTLKVNLQLLDEDWQRLEAAAPGSDAADVARRSRRRIAILLEESGRLERILEDFLQYVGRRELRPAPIDLNLLVRDLADFYRPQAHAARIDLQLIPAPRPLVCAVDTHLLKQAVLNLLINAQQAMPEGGRLELRLSEAPGGLARLDVQDTGPGIPPQDQEQIFLAYYSTKKGGTGLGLATAQRIVREHGGHISVRSQPPAGACFTILLPLAPSG
jgi:signal transduction histidine kinase